MANKLIALCIGINEYKHVGQLKGCVPDATNMYNYLEESSKNAGFDFDGLLLTNEEATKANIVEQFHKQLIDKAKANDVAVFYFSGHGAEEKADDVFETAMGGKPLSTLVCVDSRNGSVTDLADKELRYLIHKFTYREDGSKSPHFVVLTDSCHSGGVTRNAEADLDPEMKPRLSKKSPSREWKDFIFSKELPKSHFEGQTLRKALPQGEHIHFSACTDSELAYEVRGSGVFTSTLLEVLKRGSGKVSYRDLSSRIRNFVKGRFPQTPSIDVVDGDKEAINNYFLGGASENQGYKVNMVYNRSDRKFVIDAGALQGLPPEGIIVDVLNNDGKVITTGKVDKVMPERSFVTVEDTTLDRIDYSVVLKGVFRNPVNIFLDKESEKIAIEKLEKAIENKGIEKLRTESNIAFVSEYASANYVVSVAKGKYSIHRPKDTRPLVEELATDGNGVTRDILFYLGNIARFEHFRAIANPVSKFNPNPPVQIEVYKVENEVDTTSDILLSKDENNVIFINENDGIRVKVVNKTDKKLFAALVLFDNKFGVSGDFLNGKVDSILPKGFQYAWEKEPLFFEIEPYHRKYNWRGMDSEFKLLISTTNFGVDEMEQSPLPSPDGEDYEGTRALRRRSSMSNEDDWTTDTVIVRLKNKDYKE